MYFKDNAKKKFVHTIARMLAALLIAMSVGAADWVPAYAADGPASAGTGAAGASAGQSADGEGPRKIEGLITINMVDADIRDILSAIALCMDKSIIYLESPVKISFSAKNVTPEKALDLLVQSVGTDKGQLGFIKDGDVIIVGAQDKLQKDFFDQMALTRFSVNYISPDVLSAQLDKLGIPVAKITLDKSSKYIWVQGPAKALSKVSSVIAALDRKENFDIVDGVVKPSINLKQIKLNYITAEQLDSLIKQLKINASTIKLDANQKTLWYTGSEQAALDISQLASLVDVPQSAREIFGMESVKLRYLTYDKLITITNQMEIPVQIIRVGSGQKNLWLKGLKSDINEMKDLVAKLDNADNAEEAQFFTYRLVNISPDDAKQRLEFLELSDVEAMVLNYPALSHELLIKCPYDMIGTVTRTLANIDIQGQKIKEPVDYAKSAYQLTKRKELITKLMDMPPEEFTISDNVARDGADSYYIMWVLDTPDNIKRIKEMIKLIDAPNGD